MAPRLRDCEQHLGPVAFKRERRFQPNQRARRLDRHPHVGVDERTPLRSVEPGLDAPRGSGAYADFLDRFAAAYRSELQAFVEAVRTGGPSTPTLADARAALAAALAADRSRAERRPVPIEEVALTEIA